MYGRYEADFSYDLLGTRDNSPHQVCQWVQIAYMGIWRWTLAGAASGVVGASTLFGSYACIQAVIGLKSFLSYLIKTNVLNLEVQWLLVQN
jgi:hypothetical protein